VKERSLSILLPIQGQNCKQISDKASLKSQARHWFIDVATFKINLQYMALLLPLAAIIQLQQNFKTASSENMYLLYYIKYYCLKSNSREKFNLRFFISNDILSGCTFEKCVLFHSSFLSEISACLASEASREPAPSMNYKIANYLI